jgi:hypothetical protein
MNEGGDVVERKIRTRSIEVPTEKDFICGKCNVKGNCEDSKEDAIKNGMAFYWDEKAGERGKIVCAKCGHWLETKKELYDNLPIKEILTWTFYFRMIKTSFTPCERCQKIIDGQWNIGIFFDKKWYERFIERVSLKLCKECNEKINELNKSAEVILGNKDYEPPIELQRKWEYV